MQSGSGSGSIRCLEPKQAINTTGGDCYDERLFAHEVPQRVNLDAEIKDPPPPDGSPGLSKVPSF